jgi:hypothetical protein
VKAATVLLIVCVGVATASQDEPRDFFRTGEVLPLFEESIVPSTIETIHREFLERHPRGEVSLGIVPREQRGPMIVYREGRRAAFTFRIGEKLISSPPTPTLPSSPPRQVRDSESVSQRRR